MYSSARFLTGILWVAVVAVAVPSRALAQATAPSVSPSPAPSAEAPAILPPELLQNAEPVYPEAAAAQRLEGTVVLRLTIDIAGRVTAVEVTAPAGNDFDEAAVAAALRLRFAPARRGDQPIAARILFSVAFKLPAEPPPPPEVVASAELPTDGAPAPTTGEPIPASPAVPPSDLTAASASADDPVEVTVIGARSEGRRLQQSAEAVNVIDTRKAQQRTADLGEVLARTQGVSVRRSGGLGSTTRFSLNGLYDEQIRFFLDGIPLEVAGYPFSIADVPVNLIDRVEVYRGVVPIRFGADALGGAVNLVTDENYDTHAAASYQVGSFGSHRITADGRYRNQATGFVVGVAAFVDAANNNYPIDIEAADASGRLHPATVPRFHDRYRAAGVTLETGLVDKPWAKRLLLRGFASGYDKELQHNTVMKVPYGEVHYGERAYGATARYEVELVRNVELGLVASYAHHSIDFVDKAQWVYDWYGKRIYYRSIPGEIESRAHDQTLWEDNLFGRALLQWQVSPSHTLRASASPKAVARTGDERIQRDPKSRDPLTAQRDLLTVVSGLEYELNLLGERLSNVFFVKDYYYHATSEEPLPGDIYRKRDTERHRQGLGDALRFRFTPWLYAKASYEYATRLPTTDEVFGDGILVLANLDLSPEVSHNANLGPRIELTQTPLGNFTVDINAFLRDSDKLIVILGNDRYFTYHNVYRARSIGFESAVAWTSPERMFGLDGMLTWLDLRNASSKGTFGGFEGDRIPNRPYLFGSWGGFVHLANVPTPRDSVEPFYNGRYVHGFFRGWESLGDRATKQTVDAQVTHDVGVSWSIVRDLTRITSTFEVDNLTNANAFDNYGVQRPGRAFYVKISGEL